VIFGKTVIVMKSGFLGLMSILRICIKSITIDKNWSFLKFARTLH